MQFLPYLNFDGTCAEAMKTYERVFGGRLESLITFGESPDGGAIAAEAKDRIMHASLNCDGGILMASDTLPGQCAGASTQASIAIAFDEIDRARAVAAALAEGGSVVMPMQETFWVEAFAVVLDRFGTSWLINGGRSKM